MKARHVMSAITLIALAGCSGNTETAAPPVTVNTPAAESAPALPACSTVFVPGQIVTSYDEQAGCMNKQGTIQFIGAHDCADGTKLWSVDATTGAPAGYARQGKKFVAVKGDIAGDRGYKRAYKACQSDEPASAREEEPVGIQTESTAVVEVTATTGGLRVSATTPATPATPAAPATPHGQAPTTEPVRTPYPGGELANAPVKPTKTSTVDPG